MHMDSCRYTDLHCIYGGNSFSCIAVNVPMVADNSSVNKLNANTNLNITEIIEPEEITVLTRIPNIPYVSRNRTDLHLDIVAPEITGKELRPAIVYVHGGGWIGGNKTTSSNDWLAEAGFFTVSIDYRLTDVATFPAQIHDVKAAIRWVRAHADEYQVDASKIGVWGSSAGGHLSALCAVTNGIEEFEGEGNEGFSSDVQCAVPICPPTDFLIDWYAAGNMPVHDEAEMCLHGLIGGPMIEHEELARKASPLWNVSASAVPQLVIQGGSDDLVPAGQVRAYTSALMQHGADVTYLEYPDEGHPVDAGIFLENEDHLGLREIILPFFQWHLMGEAGV